MTTAIAYYRVSTDRQGRNGLGMEAQQKAVEDYVRRQGWTLTETFTEVESGKKNNRPELAKAIAAVQKGKAKLVIAKLDRLARNVAFVSNLMESKVDFVAVDFPEANKLTIHILAAVAEHEREMISQRTKAALAAKKARGEKLGSPNLAEVAAKGRAAGAANADQFADNVRPIIESIRASGVTSFRGIADALNARGIPTARGRQWHASTVRKVEKRPTGKPIKPAQS